MNSKENAPNKVFSSSVLSEQQSATLEEGSNALFFSLKGE
jgi:hypothetical protein